MKKPLYVLLVLSTTFIYSCTIEDEVIQVNTANLNAMGTITFNEFIINDFTVTVPTTETLAQVQTSVNNHLFNSAFTFPETDAVSFFDGNLTQVNTYVTTQENIAISLPDRQIILKNASISTDGLKYNETYNL